MRGLSFCHRADGGIGGAATRPGTSCWRRRAGGENGHASESDADRDRAGAGYRTRQPNGRPWHGRALSTSPALPCARHYWPAPHNTVATSSTEPL